MTNILETINTDRTLAVDGDIIAYRTAAICEDHFEGAVESIITATLRTIATDTGISSMRIYLSGRDNFRYKIAKTKPYKGNRDSMTRPRFLSHAKKYLIEKYNAIQVHGYEADDGIASDMVQNGAIHCGIDKDLLQIPGDHYNYISKTWQKVNQEEADIILTRQVLMGDASDNIPGLPRVGIKKAESIITNAETAYDDAVKFYEQVCREKLPDVNHLEYFNEQLGLVSMVTTINLLDLFTIKIDPDTEGFSQVEDELVVEKDQPKL